MDRISELKEIIAKYDTAYRNGEPLIEDVDYDILIDELTDLIDEDDEFFESSIKEDTNSSRRQQLPIIMASTEKVKNIEELQKWVRLKNIPSNTQYIILPKYDGISLCKEELSGNGWTRGRKNNEGLMSGSHLSFMCDQMIDAKYTYGECIISRDSFEVIKDSCTSSAARNVVSGFFRRDIPSDELEYVDFIKYGIVDSTKSFTTKEEIITFLNKTQKVSVPYKLNKLEDLTADYLKEVYLKFSENYELDGLIIEVDDLETQKNLGRNKSSENPNYLVAYKGSFEEVKQSSCIEIEWNISKGGNLIPVCIINPIMLENTNVSRITLNNALFAKNAGVEVGSLLDVKKSGGVIPSISKVITTQPFKMPDIECYWDGVHLKTTHETDDQKKKKLFAFFKIIGVENASDKTFDLLFDSGYKTIKDILSMSKEDFVALEGFQDKKASKTFTEIHSRIGGVSLPKLQHSTGLFKLLGSKKLTLLEHFEGKPNESEITSIPGFSDISAKNYLDGYDAFWEFYKEIESFITIKKVEKIIMENNKFEGMNFVFTGFRSSDGEEIIQKGNGRISSSLSKSTTHLITKDKSVMSSKMIKALEYGAIVWDASEFEEFIKQ